MVDYELISLKSSLQVAIGMRDRDSIADIREAIREHRTKSISSTLPEESRATA